MAENTTTNKDFINYNQTATTTYYEGIQDNLNAFNSATRGAIVLDSMVKLGDFTQASFFNLNGKMQHRDVNSTEKAAHSKIGMEELVTPKVPWKFGIFSATEESFKRKGLNAGSFAALVGQNAAQAQIENYLDHALGALQAALTGNNMVAKVDPTKGGAPQKQLTAGLRKLGDRAERIVCFIMNSADHFDFIDKSIDNKVYEEAGTVVYGGSPGTLNRPVLVTDKCPAGKIFGLQVGAVTITESQETKFVFFPITDQENLAMGYRGEGTFNIEVMGYSYQVSQGNNPRLDIISAPASWKKVAVSDKATAGIIVDLTGK